MKIEKIVRLLVIIIFLSWVWVFFWQNSQNNDTLYQVSVLSGLMKGDYDGKVSLGEIRRHGDFGIGTFDRLDGEAIELNGVFYQVKSDGSVHRMPALVKSPFEMATFFSADSRFAVTKKGDYRALQEFIDTKLEAKKIPCALKIEGKFDYIKVRSVPIQTKPYEALSEVIKNQSVFEFHDIDGVLVGFRMPDYLGDVNIPGFHMHFLSRDKTKGGHLLECTTDNAEVSIDDIKSFEIVFPESKDFNKLNLASDIDTKLIGE